MYSYREEQGSKDPFFYFSTKNNLTYYVAFRYMPHDSYPLHNVFSLDFGEIDGKKACQDTDISTTILNIIIRFVEEDQTRVIHYLCENSDSRQLYRKRLFNRWFSISNTESWTKYDYDFDNADYNISFLYNSNIYETGFIEQEILLTLDVYERAKNE